LAHTFHRIINVVSKNQGGNVFICVDTEEQGKSSCGNLWSSFLRCQRKIVFNFKWNCLSFPSQRKDNTFKNFKISVPILDNSFCNIMQGSEMSQLLKQVDLIIWDETPMRCKFYFEALDKTLNENIKST